MHEIAKFFAKLPEPATIDLSNFSGRIFPEESVHPGTFSISVPLEQANGPDAVTTYGTTRTNLDSKFATQVAINSWKPDSKTTGVFQKGQKIYTSEELWHNPYVAVRDVSFANGIVSVYPCRYDPPLVTAIICHIAVILFNVVGCAIIISTRKKTSHKRGVQWVRSSVNS